MPIGQIVFGRPAPAPRTLTTEVLALLDQAAAPNTPEPAAPTESAISALLAAHSDVGGRAGGSAGR